MSHFVDAIEISFDRRTVNGALRSSGNNLNSQYIGMPRGSFTEDAQDPDNHDFIQQIEVGSFAGQRIYGLRPFIQTLHARKTKTLLKTLAGFSTTLDTEYFM